MTDALAYGAALVLSLVNGKLVAGAISGIVLSPLESPFKGLPWISRYAIPFIQGIAMGFVAVCTAKWVLAAFGLHTGVVMIAMIIAAFVAISSTLLRRSPEKHFHLSAGLGELFGIVLGSYYILQLALW